MISILQDPTLYLDKPSSTGVSNNVAALANVIHKLSRGTAAEKDSLEHSMDGVLFCAGSLDGLWLIHDNYPSSIPLFYIVWDTLRNLT